MRRIPHNLDLGRGRGESRQAAGVIITSDRGKAYIAESNTRRDVFVCS